MNSSKRIDTYAVRIPKRNSPLERRNKRLAFLRDALSSLDQGYCASHTTLRLGLNAKEMKAYMESLRRKLCVPNAQEKRVLQAYNQRLRRADAKLVAAAKLSRLGSTALKRALLYRQGRDLYCHAQDWILELTRANGALNYLFDRVVDEEEIGDYPESMPRLTTSTSEYMLDPRDNHWYALLHSIQSEAVRNSFETLG